MGRTRDLSGQIFGRLTVLNRVEDYVSPAGNKKARWLCKCSCGNTICVTSALLINGKTKSCGCLRKEVSSERSFENLEGNKYGRLTVLYRIADKKSGGDKRVCWRCRCDCGTEVNVLAKTLKNGLTQSCGCLKRDLTSQRTLKDLTAMRFGRWTVLKRDDDYISPSGYRRTQWLCKCDCGVERSVDASSLLTGRSISCGCYSAEQTSKSTLIDVIGEKFGRLTVVNRTDDHITIGGRHIPKYRCICECGNFHEVTSSLLLSGKVKSCGCLREENWATPYNFNNLEGKKFGRWTVLYRSDNATYSGGSSDTRWMCKCECGTEKMVLANSLIHGKSLSCGCWSQSKLEVWVNQYFESIGMQLGIDYFPQQTFDGLTGLNMGMLRYDFSVMEGGEITYLIECQGEQHYRPVNYFGGEEKFEIQVFHDELKREYAESLGISLIEIPYNFNSYDKVVAFLNDWF